MSLRHALLGLLADEPASGYELTKKFENTLHRYAWSAKHSQIYPELNRLAADGLIEVIDEGSRGKKTYAITESGHAELRRWLMTPPSGGVRNEFVLRLFLLSALEAPEARRLLGEYAAEADRDLEQLRAFLHQVRQADPGWPHNPLEFGHLAAEYGLRALAGARDWARWAIEQIDQAGSDAASGSGPGHGLGADHAQQGQ
jgi:PadR family transcriptional regulator AphA